ncbi:MAG: ATP-binding cassette domain-containing protein [Chitinophagaceae bacterium]
MKIRFSNAGKRFNREWIFRNVDIEFSAGNSYAITGPNGSGKSTLLQTIGGLLQPSEGKISFYDSDKEILPEKVYQSISFCAPYLDLVEEMTLVEFIQFHNTFKSFLKTLKINEIIDVIDLRAAANKQILYYSSGMKQRVKLAQAIFSETDIVLLDEPCTNLDAQGIELYHSLIKYYCKNRLVIVSSNDEVEYEFCKEKISMNDFKYSGYATSYSTL